MNSAELTATQLVDAINRFCNRNQDRLGTQARTVLEETVRRLKQHELLLRDVLPDLRARLTAAEESACTAPPGASPSSVRGPLQRRGGASCRARTPE